jgi:hypothetical protein
MSDNEPFTYRYFLIGDTDPVRVKYDVRRWAFSLPESEKHHVTQFHGRLSRGSCAAPHVGCLSLDLGGATKLCKS